MRNLFTTNLIWLLLTAVFLAACRQGYKQEQLYGAWEIVEVNARGQRVPISKALDIKCITFTDHGTYFSCDNDQYFLKGEWMVKGKVLRLHSKRIKDLNGRELDKSHDSEWEIINNEEWMVWNGTSKYKHQHLRLTLRRIKL